MEEKRCQMTVEHYYLGQPDSFRCNKPAKFVSPVTRTYQYGGETPFYLCGIHRREEDRRLEKIGHPERCKPLPNPLKEKE